MPATEPGCLARCCRKWRRRAERRRPRCQRRRELPRDRQERGVVCGRAPVPWITDGHRRREFDCPHREADAPVTRLEPDLHADRRRSAPGVFQHGRRQAEGRRLAVQRSDLVERVVEFAVRLGRLELAGRLEWLLGWQRDPERPRAFFQLLGAVDVPAFGDPRGHRHREAPAPFHRRGARRRKGDRPRHRLRRRLGGKGSGTSRKRGARSRGERRRAVPDSWYRV